jgi:NAD(P)-dependent dehydrogenase (short-subunit alcohol dehydrogenase family)
MKKNLSVVVDLPELSSLKVTGLKAAVVGGTGGIGQQIAHALAARAAQVLVVGRTFRDAGKPGIDFLRADLSLMSEAQRVAAELPAETLDLVVFTTGIMAASARQETAEGIERDMAVSYLSRLVSLRGIGDRLRQGTRVFIMGYPGSGKAGTYDDLNAERSYKSMAVHMNTVAGNEMLVLDAAKRYPHLRVFGLNPGFVKTDIRANLLGAGSLRHRLLEGAVGLVTASAGTYAGRITPLLVVPELDQHTGVKFNNKGQAIQPTQGLTDQHIEGFMTASAELVSRAGVDIAR